MRLNESKISYPVNIYVFSGDVCIETAKIESEETPISLRLPEGSYDVYAIAGADTETYNLPTKENAAKEYLIKLNDGKIAHRSYGCKKSMSLWHMEKKIH